MTGRPARQPPAKRQAAHPKAKKATPATSLASDRGAGARKPKSRAVARPTAPQVGTVAVITSARTKRQAPAITSDQWHVVHSQWVGKRAGSPPFERHILSEHPDRAAAVIAAKKVVASLNPTMRDRPAEDRDQLLVRPPGFRSLKFKAARTQNRPR